MTKYLVPYCAVLIAFVGIDMAWLMGVARSTYVAEMGALLRKQPNLAAAGVFYLVYAAGIMFFAVRPATDSGSILMAVGLGAALGFLAYGTYDLTNLSVMEGFGLKIAIIDLVWGTVLTAIVAGIGAASARAFA